MNIIEKIKRKINGFEISTKITLGYSACFVILLIMINVAMWLGVMNALYTPAEEAIRQSMENIQVAIDELSENEQTYKPSLFRRSLETGVVLRVLDEQGNLVVDTDGRYTRMESFNEGLVTDRPLFAAEDFNVARVGSALIYCGVRDYTYKENNEYRTLTLCFYRTITSELKTYNNLEKILLFLDVLGMFAALFVGRVISRRILTPIRNMNDLAREVAFEKMDKRIPIGAADDELNELAKTLNDMLDRLQGGINRQQQFVSDASHELRTPAAVIKGYIDFIETYGTQDEALLKENLKVIGSEAQNMQALLENLLFLSRTDRHTQKLHKKTLDLDDIVNDVMSKMKTVVHTHEVKLIKNDPAQIYGDETTIRQMIRIFLDNAVKYTPPGGTISVTSTVKRKKISLCISDTGIGIAPENLEKIFDRFFRIDSEDLVSEANGSGLGLSIAKWIADSHDIAIGVDSEPGKGTTFTLTIPVARQQ